MRISFLRWLPALTLLAACNFVLDIDKNVETADAAVDGGGASCTDDGDCRGGEQCVRQTCVRVGDDMDAELPSPEAGMDTSVPDADPKDGGPDGKGKPDGDAGKDGDTGTAECEEGAFRCEANASPVRSECKDGAWRSGASCEADEVCHGAGECAPVADGCLGQTAGDPFCVGPALSVCDANLVNIEQKECRSAAHCRASTGAECAACVDGEARCNGNDLLVCNEDRSGFEYQETCNNGECNEALRRCSPLLCDPDAYSCIGDDLHLCNAQGTDYAAIEECDPGLCDAVNRRCNTCEPGEVVACSDSTTQAVCNAQGTDVVDRSCASIDNTRPVCTGNGVCVACEPLTQTCQDNTTLVSCSAQGTRSSTQCVDSTCVGGQCFGECEPGEARCAGQASAQREVCRDGAFVQDDAYTCSTGLLCNRQTNECSAVEPGCSNAQPGDAVCEGAIRKICGPDLVSATNSDTCDSAALCQAGSGAECAACLAGEHRCEGAELQVCSNDRTRFVLQQRCDSAALCNDTVGQCTAQVCNPNQWYCTNDDRLRHCNSTGSAFVSEDGQQCAPNLCDLANRQCDECEANQPVGCSEGQRERCNATGQGTVLEDCPNSAPVCIGSGECVECQPNTATCEGNTRVVCDAQGRRSTQACGSDLTCVDGECVGECGPGQMRCAGSASRLREVCGPDGFFGSGAPCAQGTLCDRSDTDDPGTCRSIVTGCENASPGDVVCAGSNRIVCGPDLVTTASSQACDSAAHCQQGSGADCADCLDNSYRCLGAQPQRCNAGNTGYEDVPEQAACPSATLCNDNDGTCDPATCVANQWSCDDNFLQQCNSTSDRFAYTRDCDDGICDADARDCLECLANSVVGCAGPSGQEVCTATGEDTFYRACPQGAPVCIGNGNCVQCQPGVSKCADDGLTLRDCGISGDWSDTTNCALTNETCLPAAGGGSDSCGGNCAVGQRQCSSNGVPQLCNGEGDWVPQPSCSSDPAERCEDDTGSNDYGTCVPNPAYNLGHSSATGSVYPWLYNNILLAQPVRPAFDVTLLGFGMQTTPATNGAVAFYSLHADADGEPGALINRSSQVSLLGNSSNYRARTFAEPAQTQLTAGTTYWVVANISMGAASTVEVYLTDADAAGNFREGTRTYASPTNLSPGVTAPNAGRLSIFIEVQRR